MNQKRKEEKDREKKQTEGNQLLTIFIQKKGEQSTINRLKAINSLNVILYLSK